MRQRGHQKTSSLSSNAVTTSQVSGCNVSNTSNTGDYSGGTIESSDINSKIAFIKKDVTLSRSHSDSYRRIRRLPSDDGLRQTASNDELQNLRVSCTSSSNFLYVKTSDLVVYSRSISSFVEGWN
jgi:hypothetical protein